MSFLSISLIGLLVTVSLLYVTYPILIRPATDIRSEQSTIQLKYDQILTNLRDLEVDYGSNKISETDYNKIKMPLLLQAAELRQQLNNSETDFMPIHVDDIIEEMVTSQREE